MEYASAESELKSQVNELQARVNDAVNQRRQWEDDAVNQRRHWEDEYNVSSFYAARNGSSGRPYVLLVMILFFFNSTLDLRASLADRRNLAT